MTDAVINGELRVINLLLDTVGDYAQSFSAELCELALLHGKIHILRALSSHCRKLDMVTETQISSSAWSKK